MNAWFDVLVTILAISTIGGLGIGVLVAFEHLSAWLQRRADVERVRSVSWTCGLDEPDPEFVARLRAELVEEVRARREREQS